MQKFQILPFILQYYKMYISNVLHITCLYCRETGHYANQGKKTLGRNLHSIRCRKIGKTEYMFYQKQVVKPKATINAGKEKASNGKEPESFTHEKELTLPLSVAEENEPLLKSNRDVEGSIFSEKQKTDETACGQTFLEAQKTKWAGVTNPKSAPKEQSKTTKILNICMTLFQNMKCILNFISIFWSSIWPTTSSQRSKWSKRFEKLFGNQKSWRRLAVQTNDLQRRLKVVTLLEHDSKFQDPLDTEAVPNVLSLHFVETLGLGMNAIPETIKLVDAHISGNLGVVKYLQILLDGLNIALDLLMVKKPPHDIVQLLTLWAIQAHLDCATETVTQKHNNKTVKLTLVHDMCQKS